MHFKLPFLLPFLALSLLGSSALHAQQPSNMTIKGRITDSETAAAIPFATISAPEVSKGTSANENGEYTIVLPTNAKSVRITALGYIEKTVKLGKKDNQEVNVALQQSDNVLQEVTVKPKKYSNKNNPAVELIKLVVEHRDSNRLEKLTFYSEKQYEKILMGLSKVPDKLMRNKLLGDMKVVFDNKDTTKLADAAVIPVMLQEYMIDLYSKNPPGIQRKYVTAHQSVEFPERLDPTGLNKGLQYLNQDINLYDNYVVLLTDHFLSPIANSAPLFYRYYPRDTTEEYGRKVVRLEFYPRNKTDMLLQGELYIALDGSYAVTRAVFGVNPNINLNWVRHLVLEQDFDRLPSGKWYLTNEDYKMDFGFTDKSFGLYGERVVRHSQPTINVPLPDSVFAAPDDMVYLPGSKRRDTTFWQGARPQALTLAEATTYTAMDSLSHTKLFKRGANLLDLAIIGYVPAGKNFEIGPMATFYSFNPVEGQRFRYGMRTSPGFSRKIRLSGTVGYGLLDKEWKGSFGADFALPGTYHNEFPLNIIRFRYNKDLIVPGLLLYQTGSNTFLTSFVRGVNDKFTYTDKITIQHEREFINHFSYTVGTEREELRPAGALHFVPTESGRLEDDPLTVSRFFLHLRYAPGEKFYQSKTYRQIIDYRWIMQARYTLGVDGIYGGEYSFNQFGLSIRKYSNTPPFGYNTMYLEAGSILGKVPYPLLNIHRANQSYVYDKFSYNLMNFMEFMSDRYVAFNIDHSFYGFFLNKIPLLRHLKLREYATVKVLYGSVRSENRPVEGSGLYYLPTNQDGSTASYFLGAKPYIEASVGVGNIFKMLRIDLVRRFTYLDHPGAPQFGIRGQVDVSF
jgi:hypothetical protein